MGLKRSGSASAAWFSHLPWADSDAAREAISRKILDAAAISDASDPPIRLATAAKALRVRSKPVWDRKIPNGMLIWEPTTREFVIHLNPATRSTHGEMFTGRVNGRLRFTYAHELAHRFFYVEDSAGGYTRAIAQLSPAFDAKEVAEVAKEEEQLCDRIAADVLIPVPQLKRFTGTLLSPADVDASWTIGESLLRIASRFEVSVEALLVRYEQVVRTGLIDHASDWVVFIVDRSTVTGRSRGGTLERRVLSPFAPHARFLYHGRPAGELGKAFMRALAKAERGERIQRSTCRLTLARHGDWVLSGWIRRLAGAGQSSRFLLWGNLREC